MRHSVLRFSLAVLAGLLLVPASPAAAAERLCDPAYEDCRQPLLELIRNEDIGIDVGFWFMEDTRYASELIRKAGQGVRVRVLMDTEANAGFPSNVTAINMMKNAGIPIRNKSGGTGILHYKMMLFEEQGTVEFSGANYSADAFVYIEPYANYVDEVIFFTDDPAIVDSFKVKYDQAWLDTTMFTNYANVTTLEPAYPTTLSVDPQMNFVPGQSFASRSVGRYKAETVQNGGRIDAIMYRITDRRHSDQMIAAVQRGVPVRLISEPLQYRDATRLWDAWNVDRMHMAGVQVRMRAHAGLSHEKLTLLHGQRMTIFGSSNWTSASAESQHEHNLFTTKPWFYSWSVDHFERKWNNLGPVAETAAFVPLPPGPPVIKAPVDGAQGQPLSVTLKWHAGPWSHKYDIYFGTNPGAMTKIVDDQELGPSIHATDYKTHVVPGLAPATTYYWRVVDRTMANLEKGGPTWSFRTEGAAPSAGGSDVVLWAWRAATRPGWNVVSDTTGAGGKALQNPNLAAPKLDAPSPSPTQYFDIGFVAEANVPYRLWIRGKAASNSWSNDSVYVQFSDSVNGSNVPQWRLNSSSAATVTIEDCSGCGLSGWGWNDTAIGVGVLGPLVYFETTGTHTMRVQVREDGLTIDQIILSRGDFLSTAPGATKSDGTMFQEQGGADANTPPPPPPPPPPPAVPAPWTSADYGAVTPAGSASYDAGANVFSVRASGADVWGTADAFRFVSQTLTGDGEIVARVASIQNVNQWTKGGVMMRDALSASSAHATMFASALKGTAFQRRVTTGGTSLNSYGPNSPAPYWVKLVRIGSTFTASASADGVTWTEVGAETIAMGSTINVGLAVTSHANGTLATVTFDNVTVTTY